MANYFARTNGNVNAAIWHTAPTGGSAPWSTVTPTSADVLYANGSTVTLNVTTTAAEVRNDSTNGATAGGTFTISSGGITLTANAFAGSVGTQCVNVTHSTGTVTLVGTITGGSVSGAFGCRIAANTPATVSITGDIIGGSTLFSGISHAGANGLTLAGSAAVTITGNVDGRNEYAIGSQVSNLTLTVNGFVSGTNAGGMFYYGSSNSTVTVNGTVTGAPNAPGISLVSTSGSFAVTATRIKGNAWGNGSSGATSQPGVAAQNATQSIRCYEVEFGDRGQMPLTGAGLQVIEGQSNAAVVMLTTGAKKTLVDGSVVSGNPSASDVRLGVVYSNGNRTGTCAVPAANQVAAGVAVGSTVGTAVLTIDAAQSACDGALQAFSGGRLANVATVASTGQQIADATV
jgi:hypothetical protein